MLTELKIRLAKLRRYTDAVLLVVASVIAFGLYAGFGLFIGDSGEWLLELVKISVAIAIGLIVFLIGKWCFDIVSALDRTARNGLLPATVTGLILVLNISTYVLTVKLGHESFTSAHMSEHLAQTARDKDAVVTALNKFSGLTADTDRCADKLSGMEAAERKGTYSGFASQGGALVDYFGAASNECKQMGETIRRSASETTGLLARLDASITAQQAAADDTSKPLKERVAALRTASEGFRNVVIEGFAKLPLSAVKGLGQSMLTPASVPALSRTEKVAKGQAQGLGEAKNAQEQIGRQLLDAVTVFDTLTAAAPAIFKLPTPSELPWVYGSKAIPILAVCVALDFSFFWFAFAAGRVGDEIRRLEQAHGPDAFAETVRMIEAVRRLEASLAEKVTPLGQHPFPAATKMRAAKSNGAARPTKSGDETTGYEEELT